MMDQWVFYIFSGLAILSSLSVITSRNPVRAVLSLVLAFVCASVIWLTLHTEFLALMLIVVYVGAVMVLFLFVVMMLDIQTETKQAGFIKYWIVAALLSAVLIFLLVNAFKGINAPRATLGSMDISALGMALFSDYLYPFEIGAVILLAAMIAAIVLTHRSKVGISKKQSIAAQIQTTPSARLRILKMPVTPKEGSS